MSWWGATEETHTHVSLIHEERGERRERAGSVVGGKGMERGENESSENPE